MQHLSLFTQRQLNQYTAARAGEQKLGQKVGIANTDKDIATATQHGYRFALIGIPESIGPVANHGHAGAEEGWDAFLTYFLNLQSNEFLSGEDVLLVGHINCDDLMKPSMDAQPHTHQHYQQLCGVLDQRVHRILLSIFSAGLIPIVIGGGHNNAYPIIKACAEAKQQAMAVTNLDPHADFRALEGRHSGNPFHYAYAEGHLERYSVLGLHEQKNSTDALNALKKLQFPFYSIQQIFWRKEITFDECITKTQHYLTSASSPIGIEVDVDAITEMPSSAITRAGISLDDALYYVHQIATLPKIQYLHLAEGAPGRHPAGVQAGKRVTGQALAELSCAFIKSA
ncbi:formimidoylglutamase [Eionea flava]